MRSMDVLAGLRMNPPLAEGLRRFGFRRWYERELLFSHLYLALALLALAGLLGAIELFAQSSLAGKLINTAFVLVCAVVAFYSVQGYLLSLSAAEAIAAQATCSNCRSYGRLAPVSVSHQQVTVRCKHCGHQWAIET